MYTQTVKYYRNLYLDKASILHSLFKNEAFIFIHQFLPEFVIFVDLNIIYIVHDIFTSIFYNEKHQFMFHIQIVHYKCDFFWGFLDHNFHCLLHIPSASVIL